MRSGYSEGCDGWELIMWRGAVNRAINGKRGQAFLREMLAALDALPQPRLIAGKLQESGEVCAIGSIGAKRRIDMSKLDPNDSSQVAATFGIAPAMVREIAFVNDDEFCYCDETPEKRFKRVRKWVVSQIRPTSDFGIPSATQRSEGEEG